MASQWKSQFDDSEETDNELKADNLQSPEHKQRLTLVSPSSHGPDDTAMTPVQDAVPAEKSRRGTELSRISEDDRHRSSDHHTHTQTLRQRRSVLFEETTLHVVISGLHLRC